jgi:hypothetical protein
VRGAVTAASPLHSTLSSFLDGTHTRHQLPKLPTALWCSLARVGRDVTLFSLLEVCMCCKVHVCEGWCDWIFFFDLERI